MPPTRRSGTESDGDCDRGISPVLGTFLMITIVLVLAALVGSMVIGLNPGLSEPAPQAYFDVDRHLDGADNGGVPYVVITHEAGKTGNGSDIYIVDSDGNEVAWKDVWTGGPSVEAPEYVHIDGKGSDCALNEVRKGEIYRIIKRTDEGSGQILAEVEIENQPPDTPGPFTC